MPSTFPKSVPASFPALGPRRLFLLGGVALVLLGMIFGDIFAVFVLHQNATRVGFSLEGAARAALAGDVPAVRSHFQNVGAFLENRGTKVDTHVHMIDFGYLALLLAILEPWVAFSTKTKQRLALIFLVGSGLLPVCLFLIHYVGLVYSPLHSIGWASIFADFGGFLVLVATLACLAGLWKGFRPANGSRVRDALFSDRGPVSRLLLSGGALLVLFGFLHGAYYALFDLYHHESQDVSLLSQMTLAAGSRDSTALGQALAGYGQLQGEKAVNIAAHAHAIEFGLLAMMLGLFQPFVSLGEVWKRRWAAILLLGSALLPLCVLLELRFGLVAGGLADVGGLLVILALLAMWIGILRYTGHLDGEAVALGKGAE